MTATSAQYLLRFDDLCPTMHRAGWERFAPLLKKYAIRPILAIVPDNRDPELDFASPDPDFWPRMRSWEEAGAAIGLHGYRHVCMAHGSSLIPIHRQTEFAGIPEPTQRAWIRSGLQILRSHRLTPKIWVAPRHGFDPTTLNVLRSEGIATLSDGFASSPFHSGGCLWIPQQLWAPVEKPRGLWTICLHSNSATDESVQALDRFLAAHSSQFTSVDRVAQEWPQRRPSLADRLFHRWLLARIHLSRARRRRHTSP